MIKRIGFIVILIGIAFYTNAQELRCNVSINTSQIQGTNKQVFQTLQKAVYEFMNTTAWTNHVYAIEERIECNLMININQQLAADEFKGSFQIQLRRPIFGTSYNSVLFNFKDEDIHFNYVEFEPLEFTPNQHISNLTSLLAYYAYIIIGLDYDSFSLEGGTEYFQKAENIVSNAQNARESGWKPFESSKRNRYWLIENILNDNYTPVRECYFRYHRLGLDVMHDKVEDGRSEIAESLKMIQQVYRKKPDPYLFFLKVFFDAKSDELVNIFSESFSDEKNRVFTILNEVDPANSSKYEKIVKSSAQ